MLYKSTRICFPFVLRLCPDIGSKKQAKQQILMKAIAKNIDKEGPEERWLILCVWTRPKTKKKKKKETKKKGAAGENDDDEQTSHEWPLGQEAWTGNTQKYTRILRTQSNTNIRLLFAGHKDTSSSILAQKSHEMKIEKPGHKSNNRNHTQKS